MAQEYCVAYGILDEAEAAKIHKVRGTVVFLLARPPARLLQ